jgi:hypothetical protein
MKDPIIIANKMLKQKFPIGKLYQINFGKNYKTFEAYINDNYRDFKCNEDVFLLLDISVQNHNVKYFKLEALFSTGERGEISLFKEYNLKLIQ